MAMTTDPRDTEAADPGLARAYRAGADDMPPAHIDARILAAARREVGAGPRPLGKSFARRWGLPVSLAAVLVLSVTVVTLMVQEGGDDLAGPPRPAPRVAETPAPAAAPVHGPDTAPAVVQGSAVALGDAMRKKSEPVSAASVPAQAPAPVPQPSTGPGVQNVASGMAERTAPVASGEARGRDAGAAASAAAPVPAPQPEPVVTAAPNSPPPAARMMAKPAVREAASEDMPARAAADRASGRTEAGPASAVQARPSTDALPGKAPLAGARSQHLRELDREPPDKWLERIAALRREGRAGEADELLSEFRKRFPDHPVPAAASGR